MLLHWSGAFFKGSSRRRGNPVFHGWGRTRSLQMKNYVLVFPLAVLTALTLSVCAFGQSNTPTFTQIATIVPPGGLGGYDINWLDPGSQRYYLADRTATKGTGRIDVVDTQTNKLLYTIPQTKSEIGFAGTR